MSPIMNDTYLNYCFKSSKIWQVVKLSDKFGYSTRNNNDYLYKYTLHGAVVIFNIKSVERLFCQLETN